MAPERPQILTYLLSLYQRQQLGSQIRLSSYHATTSNTLAGQVLEGKFEKYICGAKLTSLEG
jgi:hypothetical protein